MTTSPRGPSRFRARLFAAAGALVVGGALALAGLVGTVTPAAAATYDPPWYLGSGQGVWGSMTFSGGTLTPNADGTYGPITLNRHYSGSDPSLVFAATDLSGHKYWKSSDTVGPFTFSQTGLSPCDFTNDTCQYYVTVSGGQSQFNDLILAKGDPPAPALPTDPPYFNQFKITTITFTPPAPPAPTWGSIQFSYTPGSGSTPDTVSFDATSVNTHGQSVTTYRWTVTKTGSTPPDTHTFDCSTAQCQQQLTLASGADYDVKLDLIDSSGASFASTSFTAGHPGGSTPTTSTTTPGGGTPTTHGTTPTTSPAAPSGGGGGGGGGEVPSVVVFARPAAAPAATIDPSTVVWLWRPDDYKPEQSTQANKSNQANPPTLKGSTAIEVSTSTNSADTSNPGPWLAGLGLFGFAAGGGLLRRRRRLRFEP